MAAYFDGLYKAGFGPVSFPIESASAEGSQRHHLHEYPHTPGSKLEKLGRRAWLIRMSPIFDESIFTYDRINGMPLYPDALIKLQRIYEEESTFELWIPTMGRITSFMTSFRRSIVPGLRSGERVDIEFVEDMSDKFRLGDVTRIGGQAYVAAKLQLVSDLARIAFDESQVKQRATANLFDKIDGAVNQVLALQDKGELYAMQVEAKVRKATSYIAEADKRLNRLQHPEQHPLLEATKELWASLLDLQRTLALEDIRSHEWEVPYLMSVQTISQNIYGTTEHALEIMQMNILSDPMAVPGGTKVRYNKTNALRQTRQL